MRRRDLLAGMYPVAAAAVTGFPAPAIAQGIRQLKMVTDWTEGPGFQTSAARFADSVKAMTEGRVQIEMFAAGTLVQSFETFDAVSAGVADMYHSFESYFEQKSQAFHFFAAIPFGLTADELFAWIDYGGGQELWDELSGQFNIKAMLTTSTGCQMGGWFTREVNTPADFKGMRYRMGGLGAEVLRRLGTTAVTLPGGEIMPALKSGAIDASEWIGPWLDMEMGLHEAASYYYYPAFHEPGSGFVTGINKGVWESLAASDRRVIELAAAGEYALSLAEFNTNNALWLRKLREQTKVKVSRFDDSLLNTFLEVSRDVVAEVGATNQLSKKIYESYHGFRASMSDWTDISERAYLNARALR
jgi:TRAP-type mannitol/chloroaromatic compound transport system substrate-binding protein